MKKHSSGLTDPSRDDRWSIWDFFTIQEFLDYLNEFHSELLRCMKANVPLYANFCY